MLNFTNVAGSPANDAFWLMCGPGQNWTFYSSSQSIPPTYTTSGANVVNDPTCWQHETTIPATPVGASLLGNLGMYMNQYCHYFVRGVKLRVKLESITSPSVTPTTAGAVGNFAMIMFANHVDVAGTTSTPNTWERVAQIKEIKKRQSRRALYGGELSYRPMQISKYARTTYYQKNADKMVGYTLASYGGRITPNTATPSFVSPSVGAAVIHCGVVSVDGATWAAGTAWRFQVHATVYMDLWGKQYWPNA